MFDMVQLGETMSDLACVHGPGVVGEARPTFLPEVVLPFRIDPFLGI